MMRRCYIRVVFHFLSEAYGIVNNLEKYGRDCFGTPLIRKITGIIHTYKIGYASEEIKKKLNY